jgi:HAE1 family hydrophobic/amphiphilic exporter-1
MGFTLNLMTMLALTLSVGIVIDDAIVVLENIYRFIEEKHDDQFHAAVDGDAGDRPRRCSRRRCRWSRSSSRSASWAASSAVHEELRPDDGVRDHGVAARQLHADADAVGALAEGEEARHGPHGSKDSKIFHAIDRFYTRMLEWSMAPPQHLAGVAVTCCSRACRCS